jgi:large subunit ribosomal protein L4
MNAVVYNQSGKEVGKVDLPSNVFGLPWNEELVHQVVVSMMGNARLPWAHTKNRGEVSGTGKKPWKQKGTGRARHGSRRSPIWVGGGIAHGPRNERDYTRKINKKMKAKALYTVLSKKLADNEILFVDNINLPEAKTKQAKGVMDAFVKIDNFKYITKKNNAAFIALDKKHEAVAKSFRNFGNIELGQVKDINPVDLMKYRYLVLVNPESSVETLSARTANKTK